MASRCLRQVLALALFQFSAGQTTKASLGIGSGSKFDSIFDTADADQDGALSQGEMAAFTEAGEELIRGFAVMKPFEVVFFSEADCMGQNRTADSSDNETRCSACFDACGKTFAGGAAMAVLSTSDVTGVDSKVRSLRVVSGTPQIVLGLCRGTYNYGVMGMEVTSIRAARGGCLNFPGHGPAHAAALPTELAELAATMFLKADLAPFDGQLNSTEAAAVGLGPLVQAADENQDGVLSVEEYATVLARDAERRRARKATPFMSAESMEEAAKTWAFAAEAAVGHTPGAVDGVAGAQELFKEDYEKAKVDPAEGVPTTTPPPELDPMGNPIVSGGPSGGDFGDVRDASPVEGAYDPQTGNIMLCVNGKEFHGGFCYDYCNFDYPLDILNMCWKEDCPDGWTEIAGGVCKKDGWNLDTELMESYNRGMGELPETCTLGSSFGPGDAIDDGTRDFTVAFVSDTQLPWCSGDYKSDVDCAILENWRLIQGLHAVQNLRWSTGGAFDASSEQVQEPLGVFITGDLTAYAHPWQYHLYRKIWETREGEDANKNLKLNAWPGLGNHDYANNLGGCLWIVEEPVWSGYWRSSCAQRMIGYIRSAVAGCDGHTVVKNFGGHVDHYDFDSAAYTVRHGRIRFVHLHNYPTYRRELLAGVASTIQFLVDEIAEAERTQDYLVLLIHDMGGHFSPRPDDPQVQRYDYFSDVVRGSRTIAVFAGHFHSWGGHRQNLQERQGTTVSDMVNAFGEAVPIIRNWAPDQASFVVTQWNVARCFWRFGSVSVPKKDQPDGDPAWKDQSSDTYQNIFRLPNCTIDMSYYDTTTTRNSYQVSASCALTVWWMSALLLLAKLL